MSSGPPSPALLIAVIGVNIWIGIPFNATILYSGLLDVPQELYEAAALDGATGWRAFWHVTWPLLRPVVNVVLVLGGVYTIKVLDIILALTGGGPANATQTIATQAYVVSFREFQFGQGAALSNILVVVSAAVRPPLPARQQAGDGAMTSANVLIRRGWAHTVIGVLILVVMLFPLYWMLDVSLQSAGSAIATPWFPVRPSFDGYATAIRDQGGNLLTSLVVSLGSVAVSLLLAAPAA